MLKPGDIVKADFPGAQGIKRRPCVVVSSELYHSTRPDVMVVVITSNIEIATAPSDCVLFDWEQAGLELPSAARIYISSRLQRDVSKIGHLSEADWREVQARLKLALGI